MNNQNRYTNAIPQIAISKKQIYDSIKLTNFLAKDSEDIDLDPEMLLKCVKYYEMFQNLSKIFILIDPIDSKVIGKICFNYMFSVEQNEFINNPTSFYIDKLYRNKRNTRQLYKAYYLFKKINKIKSMWGYFEENNNVFHIYKHWGYRFHTHLSIFSADFILKNFQKNNLGFKENAKTNVNYLKQRYAHNSSKSDKNYNAKKLNQTDLSEIKPNTHKYINILSELCTHLNYNGLVTLFKPSDRNINYSIAIRIQNVIVGVATIHRSFNDWRGGFWVWVVGIYLQIDMLHNIANDVTGIFRAIQKFFLQRADKYLNNIFEIDCKKIYT